MCVCVCVQAGRRPLSTADVSGSIIVIDCFWMKPQGCGIKHPSLTFSLALHTPSAMERHRGNANLDYSNLLFLTLTEREIVQVCVKERETVCAYVCICLCIGVCMHVHTSVCVGVHP